MTGYHGVPGKGLLGTGGYPVRAASKSDFVLGFKLRVSNVGGPACDNYV